MKNRLPATVLSVTSAVFMAAGTIDVFAAGFVKNADVGGYRVIVEGGGVEARKEIQYDAEGNVVYDSRGINLQSLNKGTIDNSLLGGGLDLNLDPTAETPETRLPEKSDGTTPENTPQNDKKQDAQKDGNAEKPPARRFKSPWAVSPEVIACAEKIRDERLAREKDEKKRSERETAKQETSVSVDPRDSLVHQPTTKDGRKMPFYLSNPNGDVDAEGGLKDFMRINENYGNALDRETYELEKNEGYTNIISMKEWHSKFSSLGAKRTQGYEGTAELFSDRTFAPEMLERKILDNSLMWTRTKESHITVNEALARRLSEAYTTGSKSGKYDIRLPAPGERTGLSMQDINRYQFRRSHSSEAGLPAVQPAGGLRNLPK